MSGSSKLPAPSPRHRRRWYRRWWVWGALVLLLLVVVGGRIGPGLPNPLVFEATTEHWQSSVTSTTGHQSDRAAPPRPRSWRVFVHGPRDLAQAVARALPATIDEIPLERTGPSILGPDEWPLWIELAAPEWGRTPGFRSVRARLKVDVGCPSPPGASSISHGTSLFTYLDHRFETTLEGRITGFNTRGALAALADRIAETIAADLEKLQASHFADDRESASPPELLPEIPARVPLPLEWEPTEPLLLRRDVFMPALRVWRIPASAIRREELRSRAEADGWRFVEWRSEPGACLSLERERPGREEELTIFPAAIPPSPLASAFQGVVSGSPPTPPETAPSEPDADEWWVLHRVRMDHESRQRIAATIVERSDLPLALRLAAANHLDESARGDLVDEAITDLAALRPDRLPELLALIPESHPERGRIAARLLAGDAFGAGRALDESDLELAFGHRPPIPGLVVLAAGEMRTLELPAGDTLLVARREPMPGFVAVEHDGSRYRFLTVMGGSQSTASGRRLPEDDEAWVHWTGPMMMASGSDPDRLRDLGPDQLGLALQRASDGTIEVRTAAGPPPSSLLPRPILLVAFGPFADRGVNGSATLATGLAGSEIAGHPVVHAVLPVRWGEPEARLPELVATHDPILLLGLGEGTPGRVAVEQRTVNARAGRDVDGGMPPSPQIDADGPAARACGLAFDPGASWVAESDLPVVTSEDAGTYLCNNLLWVIAEEERDRAGFVHLPPQGATEDAAYTARLVPILRRLISDQLNGDEP